MAEIILMVLISAVLACLVHEAGHYFTALSFGERIVFRFAWGKLWGKVPITAARMVYAGEFFAAAKKDYSLSRVRGGVFSRSVFLCRGAGSVYIRCAAASYSVSLLRG